MSGSQGGPAELVTFSFDVRFEGSGVGRLGDSLTHNKKNVA
ncbi:MAG: PAAR-like domain-containing protein [Polyangiaceae bacterium]